MLINQRLVRRAGMLLGAALLAGTALAVASPNTDHSPGRAAVALQQTRDIVGLRQTHPHRVPSPHATVQPMGPIGGKVGGKLPHTAMAFDATTVRSLAVSAGQAYGDATPTNISAVHTTRGEANQIMEPGLPTSGETTDPTPVILVTMTGSFKANGVPIPPGAAVPTGTTLTVAYDAATGAALDQNLRSPSDSAPPPNLATAATPVMPVANSVSADGAAARRLARARR